jgi:hypothetical protein
MFQTFMPKMALSWILKVLVEHHPHYASNYSRSIARRTVSEVDRIPSLPPLSDRTLNLVVQHLHQLDRFRAGLRNGRPHPPYISSRVR